MSAALHGGLAVIAIVAGTVLPNSDETQPHGPAADQRARAVPHLVFLAPELPRAGGGGGGGGAGSETITRRVRKPAPAAVPQATSSCDGRPSHIQVIRSLHPELDDEAVAAVGKWRFEPGRLAGEPVDVLVTIMLDFWIR